MKKGLAGLLIILLTLTLSLGCKAEDVTSYLVLIYKGSTNTTLLLNNRVNNKEKGYEISYPKQYIRIERGSDLEYNFKKTESRVNLRIEKVKENQEVDLYAENENEVILNEDLSNKKIKTDLEKGRYIYIFSIDWEDKTTEYVKFIEII